MPSDQLSTYHTSVVNRSSHVLALRAVHLRQPGDAGTHVVTARLARRVVAQVLGQQRTRTHDAHLASQHVDQFGQLVEARRAQQATEARQALFVGQWTTIGVDGVAHRPELVEAKRHTVEPRALLARTRRGGHDGATRRGRRRPSPARARRARCRRLRCRTRASRADAACVGGVCCAGRDASSQSSAALVGVEHRRHHRAFVELDARARARSTRPSRAATRRRRRVVAARRRGGPGRAAARAGRCRRALTT